MFRSILATAVAVVVFSATVPATRSASGSESGSRPQRTVLPEAKSDLVVTDGVFSPGEWDGAFRSRLSQKIDIYLQAGSRFLYVGFRFLDDVEADFVSEVYLASSDSAFLNLHSSGALGEGVNRFSPDLKQPDFFVDRNTGWQSNVTGIGARSEGKEFKISRELFPGPTVKMAGGMMVVNRTMRETGNFPADFGFESTDGWMELVLPEPEDGDEDSPVENN